jgi:putative membrane-bound dehydrogenase-like protein
MPENSIVSGLLSRFSRPPSRVITATVASIVALLHGNAQTTPTNRPMLVPAEMFSAADDLEVTVWATTPLLYNPTNIEIDKDGRVWVAEGVDYRSHSKRRPEGDRIVILEDTQGKGKADKSTVFVQEKDLIAPLGIAVLDNKVIVSQPPDMIVYTDVNRDRKFDPAVDKREVLLTGFNGRNHDHSLHSVTAGPDGLWYWNQGNTGAQFTDRSGKTFRIGSPYDHRPFTQQVVDATKIAGQKSDDGHVWIGGFTARMNPDGTDVHIIGFNYRNSYEQTVTSFGDIFQSDNDDPPACRVTPVLEFGNAGFASIDGQRSWRADMRPGQTVPIAEWRQEDPGTMPAGDVYGGGSPTGVAFYETGALGKKWRGLLLTCEAGRNVIFGYMPKPNGAGFKLERFDFLTSNKEKQFAGSDFLGGDRSVNNDLKTMFRPSDVVVGPDGAIYVTDWFDGRVGGHADLDANTAGTIYRIAPKGFKSRIPKFDLAKTSGQIEALKSPAVNVRNSGFTRLKAQGGEAVPAVAKLLKDENPYIAARAIWLLAQMGPKGTEKVVALLHSQNDTTRLVAYRALRRANHNVLEMAAQMAGDDSAAIRREVALTMRDVPLEQSRDILLRIAERFDGHDRAYLEAFGIGCGPKETEIYHALASKAKPAEAWPDSFAWIAWRLHSPEAVEDLKARALSTRLSNAQRKLMLDALAFVDSREAAMAMVDLAVAKDFPAQANAIWWLFNRKDNLWKEFGLADVMKQRGLYDPDKVQLVEVVMPPAPTEPSKLPSIPEILKLKGQAERGKNAVTVCYTCHQIGSQGSDFGPNITMFGKTQTREVLLKSIIDPSAEISHGFEASEVITKDGTTIDGIVLTTGDPLIIKSMAGQVQTVPRSHIKSNKHLNRSLMFSADMLGLDAQTLADIVAYLQSNEIK